MVLKVVVLVLGALLVELALVVCVLWGILVLGVGQLLRRRGAGAGR